MQKFPLYQLSRCYFDSNLMKLMFAPYRLHHCDCVHAGHLLRWSDCPVVAPDHQDNDKDDDEDDNNDDDDIDDEDDDDSA